MGLQSNVSSAISLFTAIVIHGLPLGSAVTTNLLKHWLPMGLSFTQMSLYLLPISCVRSVGQLLGLVLLQIPGATALILSALLQV